MIGLADSRGPEICHGAIAQLVERVVRNDEATCSIQVSSTAADAGSESCQDA